MTRPSVKKKKIFLYFSFYTLLLVPSVGATKRSLVLCSLLPTTMKSFLSCLFSRMSSCCFLTLSSQERCFNPSRNVEALCWPLFCMSTSLLYWEARSWAQYSRCVSPVLSRREGLPPSPAGNSAPGTVQEAVCHETALLPSDHLRTDRTPRTFLQRCFPDGNLT